ncbi:MAG TPA: hypothetical protein VK457_13500 [Chloroflexota bacterium]|nr:hypothetical protein [Chloroflexota bacterium]
MISEVRECWPEEVRSHLLYLLYTPVCQYACSITRGGYGLRRAVINSISYLGSLPTIFQNLGTADASTIVGHSPFLVKDVMPVLQGSNHPDDSALLSIQQFMAMEAEGTLDLIVTLLKSDAGYVILDGNKRVVAFYEQRKQQKSDGTALPVFVIAGVG